jgi:hypothetical protein
MTTDEAISISISNFTHMPYQYREVSKVLADAVLNLRHELEEARELVHALEVGKPPRKN